MDILLNIRYIYFLEKLISKTLDRIEESDIINLSITHILRGMVTYAVGKEEGGSE